MPSRTAELGVGMDVPPRRMVGASKNLSGED